MVDNVGIRGFHKYSNSQNFPQQKVTFGELDLVMAVLFLPLSQSDIACKSKTFEARI